VSGSDAVDDPGVPVVQDSGQVMQEDHGHAGIRTELSVRKSRSADIDRPGRRVLVGGTQARLGESGCLQSGLLSKSAIAASYQDDRIVAIHCSVPFRSDLSGSLRVMFEQSFKHKTKKN
jgi:hypothetical protein